jgi:hypothetical protein
LQFCKFLKFPDSCFSVFFNTIIHFDENNTRTINEKNDALLKCWAGKFDKEKGSQKCTIKDVKTLKE